MYFSKAIVSAILGFSAFAAAAPLDVDAGVNVPDVNTHTSIDAHVRRDNDAFGIKASDASWAKWNSICTSGKVSKRDLLERRKPNAPISPADVVEQGQNGKYLGIPLGLWTYKLRTCIGVVITGESDKKESGRILAHLQAAETTIEGELKAVTDWVDKNLKKSTTKGYISFPDIANWNRDDDDLKKLMQDIESKVYSKVEGAVQGNPTVVHRDLQTAMDDENSINGQMTVDGSNAVTIAGKAA